MFPRFKLWLLPSVLLLLPCVAWAQHGRGRVRTIAPPRQPVLIRSASWTRLLPVAPRIVRLRSTSGSSENPSMQGSSSSNSDFVVLSGSSTNIDQLLDPSPSFGFSFEHLNAVNPDLAIKTLIDPITQDRLALAERLLRETPVAPISFPFIDTEPVVMTEQQPPVIVLQQPQPVEVAPQAAAHVETRAAAPSEPRETPLPSRDVSALTLVKKDGTRVSVVAFTSHEDLIVYITPDGLRRSFPAIDLDKTATEQANDDQGISLQLSQ